VRNFREQSGARLPSLAPSSLSFAPLPARPRTTHSFAHFSGPRLATCQLRPLSHSYHDLVVVFVVRVRVV